MTRGGPKLQTIEGSESAKNERKIRSPEFAERLASACDKHPHCPPMHNGRLVWIQKEIGKPRYGFQVTLETVRKWYHGEVMPRPDKIEALAEILQVDQSWLQIGVDRNMAPREKKVRNAMASGAVNVVAGLIQLDGGNPAFPVEGDRHAPVGVDLYAIIKGVNYPLHVTSVEDGEDGVQIAVPVDYEDIVVLVVIREEGTNVSVYRVPEEVINQHGANDGGSIVVTLGKGDVSRKLAKIRDFRRGLFVN
jgi:transcriptional regulator with XRE-family HTH domain